MNHEEKLEKMKKARRDEYARMTLLRGDNLAVCVSMLVAIVLFAIKLIARREIDYGICAVLFSAVSVQTIHEGVRTEESRFKKYLYIVSGILVGITAIMAIILFLNGVNA